MDANAYVFDATLAAFEPEVILKSKEVPVLVDFWAAWCGPCKTLGPILEKLAAEFAGGFVLAKVDVDAEQQLAGYFQIKSIPTVMLLKDGQIVDGFPGALPEGQLREFLKHHGIEPRLPEEPAQAEAEAAPVVVDPHETLVHVRAAVHADPDKPELKLDLALALLATGGVAEAEALLDALPANLATDERAVKARARLGFASLLKDAPPREPLLAAIAADPGDLRARHLLGVRLLVEGESEPALQQFMEMLRRDKTWQDQLPKRTLIDAFRVIEDADLVGDYRRKMASLLF
ncbi:MAG: thioredoxin [Gammaproteobacteria bacterium RIFCSPHIGHO2_12_FULL_63_22]|nr:MAG: thioredoxin [Gammaproteobacteria bacterium RIFCSPHIGHO2_12_FULL_63_22]